MYWVLVGLNLGNSITKVYSSYSCPGRRYSLMREVVGHTVITIGDYPTMWYFLQNRNSWRDGNCSRWGGRVINSALRKRQEQPQGEPWLYSVTLELGLEGCIGAHQKEERWKGSTVILGSRTLLLKNNLVCKRSIGQNFIFVSKFYISLKTWPWLSFVYKWPWPPFTKLWNKSACIVWTKVALWHIAGERAIYSVLPIWNFLGKW